MMHAETVEGTLVVSTARNFPHIQALLDVPPTVIRQIPILAVLAPEDQHPCANVVIALQLSTIQDRARLFSGAYVTGRLESRKPSLRRVAQGASDGSKAAVLKEQPVMVSWNAGGVSVGFTFAEVRFDVIKVEGDASAGEKTVYRKYDRAIFQATCLADHLGSSVNEAVRVCSVKDRNRLQNRAQPSIKSFFGRR